VLVTKVLFVNLVNLSCFDADYCVLAVSTLSSCSGAASFKSRPRHRLF
jgi:hypothetical protein